MNWLMIIEREMNVNTLKSVYFIGAGGIGMSALVRYFLSKGKNVGGYDRTPSELTEKLIEEGAAIHYEDSSDQIPASFRDASSTLVVYTPAIPETHKEFTYFRENGFEIQKRSQASRTDYGKLRLFYRCSRHTRQDNHFDHDSPLASSIPCRL